MIFLRHILCLGAATFVLAAGPVQAQRLTLTFLPPDLPPGDICNIEQEQFDDDETQITDISSGGAAVLDNAEHILFLSRDIRDLQKLDADRSFDFIMALISRLAELDPSYAGVKETFDRIDTYLMAGRLDELKETSLLKSLTYGIDAMGWSETVRLSRFYMNGIGVEKDRDFAIDLIVDKAFLGSANALLEILAMQLRGEDVGAWTTRPEDTARLAFGGLIGQQNKGLCDRAERMAREYTDGDLLTPNPDLAYAWRKFAADLGGAEAAWRVVEYHLNASAEDKDEAALLHYLQKAVANGFVVLPEAVDEVVASGATTEAEIRRILGFNYGRSGASRRSDASVYLDLNARLVSPDVADDSDYLQYLREIAALPDPHPTVLTRLAREILLRKGRWAGAAEAIPILRQAVAGRDVDAMMMLSELVGSERNNPASQTEAETLLTEAVTRYGHADAMAELDEYYRCRAPGAPLLSEADYWANRYRAADTAPALVASDDLARMNARQNPETIARIQSLAIRKQAGSMADWLEYLQSNLFTPAATLRHWAVKVSQSDNALEDFMVGNYALALTAAEANSAIELFRRAYLEIGPGISLELAVSLVESNGRDPAVAAEVRELLEDSAHRGEGAAIRLLQRLTGEDEAAIYARFATEIEERGDLLAYMIAAPHVSDETFHRYMDRAVFLMNCTTKDVAELSDAYLRRGWDQEALRWMRISLALEGGNTLSKLGISDLQVRSFDGGLSISEDMVEEPRLAENDFDLTRQRYLAVADPRAERFDPEEAGRQMAALFQTRSRERYVWALSQYRKADPRVRREADLLIDVRTGLERASADGDPVAQYELGLLVRSTADTADDLKASTEWLGRAAEGGHRDAMVEYAFAIGFGIGRPADPRWALTWLDRVEGLQTGKARNLREILSAMVSE